MKAPKKALSIFSIALVVTLAFFIAPAVTDSGEQASARARFQLIYYDGHTHTTRSDGTGSVADIKATAQARGLSAVIITDHCKDLTLNEWQSLVAETAGVSEPGFLALPGVEVTGSQGGLSGDHFAAWNISDPFVGADALELCPEEVWPSPPAVPINTGPVHPENLTKWVDYIHSQGGIAVHAHPSGQTRLEYGVKNVEIWNQDDVDALAGYARALGIAPDLAWGLAVTVNNFAIYGERDLTMMVPFPGIGIIPLRLALYYATWRIDGVPQWLGSPENPLSSWDRLLMAYVDGTVDTPVFGVANSDAHNTGDPGSIVGLAKNGLYVKALTAEEVYKAIKAGRSFATNGPSLAFDVNGEHMGDTAYIASGGSASLNLRVKAETAGYIVAKIDIIKNGVVWRTIRPLSPAYTATLVDSVTTDGYYRIEVTSVPLPGVAGLPQFAWSNPVFVDVP